MLDACGESGIKSNLDSELEEASDSYKLEIGELRNLLGIDEKIISKFISQHRERFGSDKK